MFRAKKDNRSETIFLLSPEPAPQFPQEIHDFLSKSLDDQIITKNEFQFMLQHLFSPNFIQCLEATNHVLYLCRGALQFPEISQVFFVNPYHC